MTNTNRYFGFVPQAFGFVLVVLLSISQPAFSRVGDAIELPEAVSDQELIQSVIDAQMAAFRDRDFEQAMSFADPSIQGLFVDASRFGAMVEQGYEPIYNNASHNFIEFNQLGAVAVQVLSVQSDSGTQAIAQYRLSKASGSWRITGVLMQLM